MNKLLTNLGIIGIVAVVIAVILFGPFFVIWAWNTLFGSLHAIDYTIWTWLSVLILGAFFRSDVKVKKS
jgi:hypothetical protein